MNSERLTEIPGKKQDDVNRVGKDMKKGFRGN